MKKPPFINISLNIIDDDDGDGDKIIITTTTYHDLSKFII